MTDTPDLLPCPFCGYTTTVPVPELREETEHEHIARDIREGRFPEQSPRQTVPVTPAPVQDEAVQRLMAAAWAEARRAMAKFPQPNYVITKVAEEAGEVVKAAVHCTVGRETPENVVSEITQAIAMLLRLYVEGDQVHGLPALAAMEGR